MQSIRITANRVRRPPQRSRVEVCAAAENLRSARRRSTTSVGNRPRRTVPPPCRMIPLPCFFVRQPCRMILPACFFVRQPCRIIPLPCFFVPPPCFFVRQPCRIIPLPCFFVPPPCFFVPKGMKTADERRRTRMTANFIGGI